MTFSIANRMMLVDVTISVWEGRKLDRAVTRKTIEDNNVRDDDALRVNKLIVTKDSMKGFTAATHAIRMFIREHTLPWKDSGPRALLRQGYQPFMLRYGQLEAEWHDQVQHFVDVLYPQEVAKASFRMADTFKEEDYPGQEELRSRFRLTLDIDAVAEASDFRVKLDQSDVESIQAQMSDAIEQRVHNAMKDVWSRVATMVEHYAARTSPDIQRFHDTTVTNLQQLVDLLPSLNLTGDPKLTALGKQLKQTLCGYDPKDLRKDLNVRAAAKAEADEIMENMRGFMAAMEG